MPQSKLPATTLPQGRSVPPSQSQHDERDLFAKRLRERRDELTGAMLRVLRFIDHNRIVALASSAASGVPSRVGYSARIVSEQVGLIAATR